MNYKDAMAIADRIDGVIKCSYAVVYDKDGNRAYSLQDKNYKTRMLLAMHDGHVLHMKADELPNVTDKENVELPLTFSENGVSEAVCMASEYSDAKLVPVTLSSPVLKAFTRAAQQAQEQYEKKPTEKFKRLAEIRQRQLKQVQNGETFYVRPASFRWYPLNNHSIADGVKKAERELNMAKKILAASAVVTAI